jgi:hypothetical protein
LVDDAVLFLNAPLEQEKQLGLDFGFRVYSPEREVIEPLLKRHEPFLQARYGEEALRRFPPIKSQNDDPSLPVTLVGPAQLLSYLDMRTDVVIFAEKDWVPAPEVNKRTLIKSLLATVGLLAGNTQVVRLRHLRDPNKDGLLNCCYPRYSAEDEEDPRACCKDGTCLDGVEGYDAFQSTCNWNSHLNWLTIFCDPDRVEKISRGKVQKCPFDAGPPSESAGASEEPEEQIDNEELSAFCFSFEHSGWSNNIAAFRRSWWIDALGHVAVLSEGKSNGELELNGMGLCEYCPKNKLGSGANNEQSPTFCQLSPGLFNHVELDDG